MSTSEYKCKHCHQWTPRSGSDLDRCVHCHELLEEHRVRSKAEQDKIKSQSESENILVIRENDSPIQKKLKSIGIKARLIFLILVFSVMMVFLLSHA